MSIPTSSNFLRETPPFLSLQSKKLFAVPFSY
ncbi:Hypothetical protein Minf_0573 [Methylacidiphilum infernorum V4]|uniref:Uncharacterized protein n=1 Tax=Methylacidiphilum infernorum (isolate V4) TaxID=481448 RepID=B3DZX0_METI4|nr:Hypothetical protein Minf_0573 [Methylacidiphilum infernorum V4]